jgi:carbon monoxide dehydrogenase subunit G
MPTVTETITIPAPLSEVWPRLSDPKTVAACIPGAELSPDQEDDVWKGSIRVKFGPTVAVFRGEATLDYDHASHRCTIEGRGIDQRGASRALANGTVAATGTDTTELTVEGEYNVTGPLETFANAGGVHVARALLSEFATNMAALVGAAGNDEPEVGAPGAPATGGMTDAGENNRKPNAPMQPAKELNAFALLWAAFKSWLKSLFSGRT